MSAPHPPSRPRLVRPDDAPPAPAGAAARRAWLLPLALAAALVAAAGWGLAARRAITLEGQVAELSGALAAARAEISARQEHLEALRGAAAEVAASVAALRALAEQPPIPAAPVPPPAAAEGPPAGSD
jgi:uncharacterized coiled-coil protein SlyX